MKGRDIMDNVDTLRSKYKKEMLQLELGMLKEDSDNVNVAEIKTKLGELYVTLVDDESVSLYDSDKNWLMPIVETALDDLYDITNIDDFADVLGITCIIRSENQQELVEASRKAGLDDYDLIYRIGNIYFMFDTPELINLVDVQTN